MNRTSRDKALKRLEAKINKLDPVTAEMVHQAALDLRKSMDDEFFKDLMDNKVKLSEILKTYIPGKWKHESYPYGLNYNGRFFYFSDLCRTILGKEWYSS